MAISAALADAVIRLVEDETRRHAIRKQAYLYGRNMIWPVVAQEYMRTFERTWQQRAALPRVAYYAKTLADGQIELPPFNLSHLHHLTDDVGILQHAIGTVPNYREGYTTDNNARGLILAVLLEELGKEGWRQIDGLASRCLAFLWHAYNDENSHFRNFMGYDRQWLEEQGSKTAILGALGAGDGAGPFAAGRIAPGGGAVVRTHSAGRARFQRSSLDCLYTNWVAYVFATIPGDRAAQEIRAALAERLYESY